MGFLDRIKQFTKRPQTRQVPEREEIVQGIGLDMGEFAKWPDMLTSHMGLDKEYSSLSRHILAARKEIAERLKPFSSEEVLGSVPERARTMTALHGNEYASQVRKLLENARFTDIYEFEDEHARFLEANDQFKNQTKKNSSALQEFMGEAVKAVQEKLQELEDAIIGFMGVLEEHRFHHVLEIQDAYDRLRELEEKRERYGELHESLSSDLERTREKKRKIREVIEEQRTLIRNDEAREALDALHELEGQTEKLLDEYRTAADDALKYYARNAPRLSPEQDVKDLLDETLRDTPHALASKPSRVSHILREAAEHIDREGPGNTRNLVKRLVDLGNRAADDAKTVSESLPRQKDLKRSILRDVAALSIYDQYQFLFRAEREEEKLQKKISFLENELNPGKRLVLEREMKDAAINLGARIIGSIEAEDAQEPESPPEEPILQNHEEPSDDPGVASEADQDPDDTPLESGDGLTPADETVPEGEIKDETGIQPNMEVPDEREPEGPGQEAADAEEEPAREEPSYDMIEEAGKELEEAAEEAEGEVRESEDLLERESEKRE